MRAQHVAASIVAVLFTISGIGLAQPAAAETLEARDARLAWWRQARFGMFIHWGPVSLKGTEISWSRANSNPKCPNKGNIPVEVYDNLYKEFNPTGFNADEWIAAGKEAGMKYAVLTAKHCDGFLLWPSKVDPHNIAASPIKRDICAEFAEAARSQGMKIGWYFSPMDWRDPDFRTERNGAFLGKMQGEIRELLGNYGRIDLMWFDHDGREAVYDQANTYAIVRQLQPNIVINNRLDLSTGDSNRKILSPFADYYTPEQQLGTYDDQRPWETCMTLGTQWAWKPNDRLKTAPQVIGLLARCAGGDGNLLLNVGPMPDGRIEPRQVEILKGVGAWMKKNGQSIYGTRGGPFKPGDFGSSTRKGNTIYIHVLKWNGDSVTLPPLPKKIVASSLLAGGEVKTEQTAGALRLTVAAQDRSLSDTVVKLDLDGSAMDIPPIAATAQSGQGAGPHLALSDPANVAPAPAGAVGQVSRAADLDVLPGFRKPPAGFGVVPFYWWLGDPLTKERLGWQLDQLTGMGISGLQINYAHSDRGGRSYGLTLPSDPPLFSDDWWKLVGWFMQQAKQRGIAISLSDYTLGIGQGYCVDEILRQHPELGGTRLKLVRGEAAGALVTTEVKGADGKSQRLSVVAEKVPFSYDPMSPIAGPEYARKFFGQFEDHFPGEGGKGLNFFFSDELGFGLRGWLWTGRFAEEFRKRKGYNIVPELPALFMDIGPRTPKVRLDYSDVMVSLTEEGFFKPVFDWHQQRGMTMGCDHGGRGRDVVEFGDYFRTQRWNQGPGADQPNLGKDLIKAKVASSIAHLYQRPRVWLEGYYGSGWGTTPAGLVDATFADFVMGYNLLSLHGLYYSTHGGWWEWAPPCNGFHMPYWKQMRPFMDCVQRLAYLLSQGHHRCDVAILYPVAPMEAGMGGPEAVKAAFATASSIYAKGVDFDFMDFQSLDRAKIVGKELRVSGESYRMLVLPAMRAIRHSTLEKALEFHRAGGIVVAVGALPEASDRTGRDDPQVAAMAKELFPNGPVDDPMAMLPERDFERLDFSPGAKQTPGYLMHRRIGPRELYALYGMPQGTRCRFRATGKVELWDPWTGQTRPLTVISQRDGMTELALPLTEKEAQLIVFAPGTAEIAKPAPTPAAAQIDLDGDWEFELKPTLDNRFGDYHWPPTLTLIGPEVRQLEYTEVDSATGPWRKVTCSFGPQFWKLGPVPKAPNEAMLKPDARWKPYEFSWRWGIEGDPGHQGYHGLKEQVHDEFIALGKVIPLATGSRYEQEGSGGDYYLWTSVLAPGDRVAYAVTGETKPAAVWLNGAAVAGDKLNLRAGPNSLLLRYDKPARTFFVVSTAAPPAPEATPDRNASPSFKLSPLAMRWWNNPAVLPFDVRPEEKTPVGWYRFRSPPGLRAMTISARGKVAAWVDGKQTAVENGRIEVARPSPQPVPVLLRIEQEHGSYAGAALTEPIKLECGPGRIALGDWSRIDGLLSYSGSAWYRKTVNIPPASRIILDLGAVAATAEVRLNGQPAGLRVSPPWRFDLTNFAKAGENRIEVLLHNTLANHYTTIPTRYRGQTTSGLFGPVRLTLQHQGDRAQLRNPVWTTKDNLRDPSVLKTAEGYHLFYSRFSGPDWRDPANWTIASVFTKDFINFENDRDISPKGYASPGDLVQWQGRYLLPYQSYPAKPTLLCFSESPDLRTWSAPRVFLAEAADLPWNTYHRVIDPSFVVDGDVLHCFFVGSADVTGASGKKLRANLLGHAITRDPKLQKWQVLTPDAPMLGASERAPDGVENVMVFRTGDHWTMIYSEGLANQHLALASSQDLKTWTLHGPIELPRQKWMARKHGAPFVWRDGDQWRMILMGENERGRTSFGLLTSPDGRRWTPLPE